MDKIKENSKVIRRNSRDYVVTLEGDTPYNVIEGAPLMEDVLRYIEEHPLLVEDEAPYIEPEPTLEELKERKLNELAHDREIVSAQGTQLASGVSIPTDANTRKILTELSVAAQDDGLLNVKLPLGNGEFLSLENNEIAGVQSVVMGHVAEAIELEARLAERVKEAENAEDVNKVKWPEDSGDLDGGEILRASLFKVRHDE